MKRLQPDTYYKMGLKKAITRPEGAVSHDCEVSCLMPQDQGKLPTYFTGHTGCEGV